MKNIFLLTRHRLSHIWMAIQVEFQGHYSVQRLRELESYIKVLSTKRIVAICLLTPLPSLVLSLLKEVPPLKPVEAGASANWVLFLRTLIVTAVIDGSLLIKMGEGASSLKLTAGQVIFIGICAGTVAMAVAFALSSAIVFPLPFGVLISTIPNILVMVAILICIFGPRLRADPSLWQDLKQQLSVINCQVLLTFIYPLYIYGFVSLSGINQALFVVILPIIKVIAKNWVSRALADQGDIKPQYVIFSVEVFNALYMSNALQSASSWVLTATIMAVDLVHFWLSMLDVMEILNKVKVLLAKIPEDHPFAKENFLAIAVRILTTNKTNLGQGSESCTDARREGTPIEKFTSVAESCGKASDAERGADLVKSRLPNDVHSNGFMKKMYQGTRVLPVKSVENVHPIRPSSLGTTTDNSDIQLFFSESERAQLVEKCTQVLFITEYIVLVEYVEVVLPIVYSLYRAVLFNMPNKDYYASFSNADSIDSVLNVLAYSSLELISLVASITVLKRTLGFSSVRQLAFVLETHAELVQVSLISIIVYVTQLPLVHFGADFSFKFSWLHSSS